MLEAFMAGVKLEDRPGGEQVVLMVVGSVLVVVELEIVRRCSVEVRSLGLNLLHIWGRHISSSSR
jgi:hypothetical protein